MALRKVFLRLFFFVPEFAIFVFLFVCAEEVIRRGGELWHLGFLLPMLMATLLGIRNVLAREK